MAVALLVEGARVEQDEAVQVESDPGWGAFVVVMLDDAEGQFGGDDACIAHT